MGLGEMGLLLRIVRRVNPIRDNGEHTLVGRSLF